MMTMISKVLFAVVLAAIVRFFIRLYQVRTAFRALQEKHGIPILPHSFLWGHLIVIGKVVAKYPSDVAGSSVPRILAVEFPELCKDGLIYFDTWPFAYPMLAVFHPDLMSQFCQTPSLRKHEMMDKEFANFSQGLDLVTSHGQYWKTWRSIFNPGFSAQNISSLVPAFVEETMVFRQYLVKQAALGATFRLEDQAMMATCDIIGRAVLGERLHIQTTTSPLYESLKSQVSWLINQGKISSLLQPYNPLRSLNMWNNNRVMRNCLEPKIRQQLTDPDDTTGVPKTINNLGIKAYLAETAKSKQADDVFLNNAIAHLKIFLLAGHDTTGTTLCWAYYSLHRFPGTMKKLREELDEVFGTTARLTADMITEDPSLLNRLTYTSAVIKETLRLYPPVGSIRAGAPDIHLIHPDTNKRYPTDGFMLLSSSHALHRDEAYYPNPDKFIPERWLSPSGAEPISATKDKNAFRPFELGPRNCIGQELAQTELRLILALTVREFDIVPQYEKKGAVTLFGEPIWQADLPGEITAHVKGGMPVRVMLRDAFG